MFMPHETNSSDKENNDCEPKNKIGFKIPGFSICYEDQVMSFEFLFFSAEIGKGYLFSFFAYFIHVFQWLKKHIARYKKTFFAVVTLFLITIMIAGALYYQNDVNQQKIQIAFNCFRSGEFEDASKTVSNLWFAQSKLLPIRLMYYLYKGDIKLAQIILSTIQLEDTNDINQNVFEGHILLLNNRLDEAELLYSKVIQTPQTHRWYQSEALWGRSRIFLKNKHYQKALDDLNKALEIDPVFILAYTQKGLVLENMNQLGLAIKQYLEAMHIIKKQTTLYSTNRLYLINEALYKQLNVLADCEQSDSCTIKIEAQTEELLKQAYQHKGEDNTNKGYKFIFCPLEIQGQNEFLSGESFYFSTIIQNKINESNLFEPVDPLAILGLMKRFQKPMVMAQNLKIASKLGKYLSTNIIIGGQIRRDNTSIEFTLYVPEIQNSHKKYQKTASFDVSQNLEADINTLTTNFLKDLQNEVLVSDQ